MEPVAQPALPDGFPWPDRTREWWAVLRTAPFADVAQATDWEFLLDTALIHSDVWGNWNIDRVGELAARVSRYT